MPASNKSSDKKKTATKKIDPEILKQRREVIEKRILRLESKLNKDRALLVQYADKPESSESFTDEPKQEDQD